MYLPDIELHRSSTLAEAADLLDRYAPHARVLAGGTDLLVDLKTGRSQAAHLVSVNRIEALHGISSTKTGLRIGALTTITQLDESPALGEPFAPIRDATSQMAARQIRNLATVGGNLASAVPCADLPPILTAMHASVALWSTQGTREVPLESFFVGVRQTARRDDEILTAVLVPELPAGFGAAYARFALRAGNGIAVASVAAGLRIMPDGVIQEARVVLGAVAAVPKLVPDAASSLVGGPASPDLFEQAGRITMEAAEPICDVRGSAEFRRELVGVLTRRALQTACDRAGESK